MKEEKCAHCAQIIPVNACQQGQLIDGEWYPLHVGCFDSWAEEEVEAWVIVTEDYGYTSDRDSVTAEIDHLEPGDKITIEKTMMPRLKYLTLPEASI